MSEEVRPWWSRPTADGDDDAGTGEEEALEMEAPVETDGPAEAESPSAEPDGAQAEPESAPAEPESAPAEPESAPAEPERRPRSRRRRRGSGSAEKGERTEKAEKGEATDRSERALGAAEEAAESAAVQSGDAVRIATTDGSFPREIVVTVADRPEVSRERKIALFCDLENIALGARETKGIRFEINLALERLLEKGKIIVKKAYADWERYSAYKRPFHEAGIELIDIPQKHYSGKNSADIKMVVDAMDLCYSKEHLDTFVLLSGDSDFSPLVSKLKENNKVVIAIGMKDSSSKLLIDNCDEFIYYEDIWRDTEHTPKLDGLPTKDAEVFGLLVDAMVALIRENKEVLWGSMIKQTMQRKRPSFNEGYYGYSAFSELLEDAQNKSIIKLKKDQRSGSYIVTGFARGRR